MDKNQENRSAQTAKEQEPGDMSSFNQRETERSTESEGAQKGKDESESYMDYNGNSEANAPARSR